mgnify:CR=1 FL=1
MRQQRIRTKIAVRKMLSSAIVFLSLALVLTPIVWIALTSFKTRIEIFTPGIIFPRTISLDNYVSAFYEFGFGYKLVNSIIICSFTTLFSLILGIPTAYALSRHQFRGRNFLATWILSQRMLPAVATAIPLFIMFSNLRIIDTHIGMILAYMSFSLPLAIWLLRGYFMDIPREIDEAALVDGCNEYQMLFRIFLPMVGPGVAVTAIFVFLMSWNDFFLALVLTRINAVTVPVGMAAFMQEYKIAWGEAASTLVVVLIPLLLWIQVVQKHLVRGLTMGAVKG